MSTKMDEEDWAYTLTVFRACLPRRGRKAEDDRRFLEGSISSRLRTFGGALCRNALVPGTAYGNASTD
jgi:hypothetical protein